MNRRGAKTRSVEKSGTAWRLDIVLPVVLAAFAFALYIPSLASDFTYDARLTVLGNDYAHDLRHLWDIATLCVIRMDVMDNNRPVYLATVMLNWALWGANPAGHHLFSNLLHALVAVLLYRLCRVLLGKESSPWVSFAAVLIFAAHTLDCEAVAQVSFRYDVIVAACILAALNLAVEFRPERSQRNVLLGGAIVLFIFLAVGAKENGVAGAPLLIAYWLMFRRRESRAGWIALCVAACVVAGAFLLARFTLRPAVSVIFTQQPVRPGGTMTEWMNIQPQIWAFYLRQIAWPEGLSAEYGAYSVRNYLTGPAALCVIAVVICQVWLSLNNRTFALGALLFWFALLPVSNIVPIYKPMADRFLYLPMAGVAIMLASFPWPRAAAARKALLALAVVAACGLSWATLQREKVWHDSLSLWTDAVEKNPRSPDACNSYAWALGIAGRYEESVAQYRVAQMMMRDKSAEDFAGMAVSLDALGRTREADDAFKKAVALDRRYATPDSLLQALIWERPDEAKLQVIADRNQMKSEKAK